MDPIPNQPAIGGSNTEESLSASSSTTSVAAMTTMMSATITTTTTTLTAATTTTTTTTTTTMATVPPSLVQSVSKEAPTQAKQPKKNKTTVKETPAIGKDLDENLLCINFQNKFLS